MAPFCSNALLTKRVQWELHLESASTTAACLRTTKKRSLPIRTRLWDGIERAHTSSYGAFFVRSSRLMTDGDERKNGSGAS